MNKKFLKVLSYIGVGLLGAFLGMGALIGVSSCANKRDDYTQINKKAVMPKRSVYNDDNKVNMNNLEDGYMLTFKSDFYQITKDFQHWYNHESWTIDLNPNNAYSNWQNNGDALWRVYSFDFSWYGDQLWLDYHYLNGADLQTINIFNYAEESNNHWLVNNNCKTFWIKDFNEVTNGSVFENFFKSIFDITEISFSKSASFTFVENINYYAPYYDNINNMFVSDENLTDINTNNKIVLLDGKFFMSGGYLFNRISLTYYGANGVRYYDDEGNIQTYNNNGAGYFYWMEYSNTIDGKNFIVNRRLTSTYQNNPLYYVLQKGSFWDSDNFRMIEILDGVNEQLATSLGRINNSVNVPSTFTYQSDVGLGNVFSLLATAFTSMIPILSIQIIPGITIGLMLFLPLIVGIIIFVIWLIKR